MGQRQLQLLRLANVTDDLIQFLLLQAIEVFKRKRKVTKLSFLLTFHIGPVRSDLDFWSQVFSND